MEFFFPADVFAAYPRQGPSRRTANPYGVGPSTNVSSGCGFDSHPLFAVDNFVDAIQHERAAAAALRARRAAEASRAEAARRAKAAAVARARREAEERQAQAYLEHILGMQQREAERRFHLEQLHRQRQEAQRRQQYEEYQRRKAYAIEKERERIAAQRAAHDDGKPLFLALEDLILGGLSSFYHALQRDDEDDEEEIELAHKNDAATTAATQAIDVKGKGKATEQSMDIDSADDTLAAAAAAAMDTDEGDPVEVGPAPSVTDKDTSAAPAPASAHTFIPTTKTEQLVFTHAFPPEANFDKSSIRADQINIAVDESQRKVTVSGLWNTGSPAAASSPTISASSPVRSASPTPSDSSSKRGRSRSPKRARVSDVDENGEEIVKPEAEEGEDDFVEVNFVPAAAKVVEKTFDLPEGANVEDLRAELSNEGLKLFTTVSA